jgi:hypothetical protein
MVTPGRGQGARSEIWGIVYSISHMYLYNKHIGINKHVCMNIYIESPWTQSIEVRGLDLKYEVCALVLVYMFV